MHRRSEGVQIQIRLRRDATKQGAIVATEVLAAVALELQQACLRIAEVDVVRSTGISMFV